VLRQLKDRGVLPSDESVCEFEERLHSSANRWAGVWGWILAGILVSMWLAAFWDVRTYQTWQFTVSNALAGLVLETPLAIGAGRYVGRVLCYGRLARGLRRDGILLRPIPDHPDGMAGLAPIGRLYVGSALLTIAAFLSMWVLLIPRVFPEYGTWRGPYAVVCEGLAIACLCAGGGPFSRTTNRASRFEWSATV
jgi:hypothetical protein